MFSKFFPVSIYQISGNSMQPVLKQGQRVVGLKWFFKLKVNDLVVIKINHRPIIKRVIKIEGVKLWVEGDNKQESTDSRTFGWINKSTVIAKIYQI